MKYNTKALEGRMDKSIVAYENNLADVRASQANPAVLNRVTFDYYGSATPIKDMAAISVSDARTLVIQPYDKSTLKAMEKAIQVIRDSERKSAEEAINALYAKLLADKRFEDLEKATKDEAFRKQLFEEYK